MVIPFGDLAQIYDFRFTMFHQCLFFWKDRLLYLYQARSLAFVM